MKLHYMTVNNSNRADLNEYKQYFRKICNATVKRLELDKNYTFSVIFVNDDEIHQINKEYRGIDRPTDVISFALMDDAEPFELEMDEVELGDIFINIDAIKRQAESYGHSEVREASFLFMHGILHLLGYDHMQPEDEKEMFGLQDEILNPIVTR